MQLPVQETAEQLSRLCRSYGFSNIQRRFNLTASMIQKFPRRHDFVGLNAEHKCSTRRQNQERNIIVRDNEMIYVKLDPSNHQFHNATTVAQTVRKIYKNKGYFIHRMSERKHKNAKRVPVAATSTTTAAAAAAGSSGGGSSQNNWDAER
ncbi:unnamed protein product [Litomosoides sigmodontis]|uniref:Uncharacterized protein n=1 Tax=Litomosoides sigmodontis TaxID=42156 RepID=A0A3P7JT96_LITSI|nr:unnamed protein product [Litomosoides sigmodontis]